MAGQPPPLFNAEWYLTRNPDVRAAVERGEGTAYEHFLLHGNGEGRAAGPLFNPTHYLRDNLDVANAVRDGAGSAYDHFLLHGMKEGRAPFSMFDADLYLELNPDVAAAVKAGAGSAIEHLLIHGLKEGRPLLPFFNMHGYLDANPDVAKAVAAGETDPLTHLLQYGIAEGRVLSNGVDLKFFAEDPVFNTAIETGRFDDAFARVGEVAPFLPTFKAPIGWKPAPDTPIPKDFVPRTGEKLVLSDNVILPDGMTLPDAFDAPPLSPPSPSAPARSFTVEFTDGNVDFGGNATGTIAATIIDGKVIFSRAGITAKNQDIALNDLAASGAFPVGAIVQLQNNLSGLSVEEAIRLTANFDLAGHSYGVTGYLADMVGAPIEPIDYADHITLSDVQIATDVGTGTVHEIAVQLSEPQLNGRAADIFTRAINKGDISFETLYRLSDTLASLLAADGAFLSSAQSYTITSFEIVRELGALRVADFADIVDNAKNLTPYEDAVVNGAENPGPASIEVNYIVADTLANLTAAKQAGKLTNHPYELIDAVGYLGMIPYERAWVVLEANNHRNYGYSLEVHTVDPIAELLDVINGARAVRVTGGDGGEIVDLSDVNTMVTANLGNGNDVFRGGKMQNGVTGGDGDDTLYAGQATSYLDFLWGYGGADTLVGGAGPDHFGFYWTTDSTPSSFDTIVDFNPAQGDRINLENALHAAPQITAIEISSTDGRIGIGKAFAENVRIAFFKDISHYHTEIFIDADADGIYSESDMLIKLTGIHDLTAQAFIL